MASVFISHRHADYEIAFHVKTLMEDLNIPTDSIFMSSEARNGVQPGEPIPDGIINQIQKTDIFLLIYTFRGEEWSYCTYELGLAVASDTKATTVVVMTLSGELPDMVKHTKAIDLRKEEEIREFVRLCCEEQDFLIRDETSRAEQQGLLEVLRNMAQNAREQRSERLHKELVPYFERIQQPSSIKHRMDYIALSVSPALIELAGVEEDQSTISERFLKEVAAHPSSDNHAFKVFGFANYTEGLTLNRLFENWEEDRRTSLGRELRSVETAWMEDVVSDVCRAVKGLNSKPSTNWFTGAEDEGEENNLQLLTVQRKRETDGSILLGVYVYRYRPMPGEIPRAQRQK